MEISGIHNISVFVKYTLSQAQTANDETISKKHFIIVLSEKKCVDESEFLVANDKTHLG